MCMATVGVKGVLLHLFTLCYVVTLAIELITGRFIKIRCNGQIPWLVSKFRGPQKTEPY